MIRVDMKSLNLSNADDIYGAVWNGAIKLIKLVQHARVLPAQVDSGR